MCPSEPTVRFFYFTQTAFDCCHQNLNLNFKSKTFQHFISSQPCDFFSLIEHWGICCSILCSQARVSSLDNSSECLHRCSKNATVPAWQITLAHNSLRHARGRQSEPAALSAAWPTWPPHSPQMTFQTGEKVLSQEHGLRAFFHTAAAHLWQSLQGSVRNRNQQQAEARRQTFSSAVSAHEFVQPDRATLKLRDESATLCAQPCKHVGLLRERRRLKKPTCHHNVDTQRRA